MKRRSSFVGSLVLGLAACASPATRPGMTTVTSATQEVVVLADPLPSPRVVRVDDTRVRFEDDPSAIFDPRASTMKGAFEAGCACESSSLHSGYLRLTAREPRGYDVDVICGRVWMPVEASCDDASGNEGAAACAARVIEHGWRSKAGCTP